MKFVPNPYDEYALEEALKLKEAAGAGETVVYCLGGDSAQETIRTALAMGIDRGVLLQSAPSTDGLEVARASRSSSRAAASTSFCSASWQWTTTTIRSARW